MVMSLWPRFLAHPIGSLASLGCPQETVFDCLLILPIKNTGINFNDFWSALMSTRNCWFQVFQRQWAIKHCIAPDLWVTVYDDFSYH